MGSISDSSKPSGIPAFNREFFDPDQTFSLIGSGDLGGKASGLAFFRKTIEARIDCREFLDVPVGVPNLAVLTTDVFDSFLKRNGLRDVISEEMSDDRIAHAFHRAEMPAEVLGDLRALITGVHSPLAVRSSSLLEDASERPFAGVYATKMTPNNQPDTDTRFHRLMEAIKFVYASTYFAEARSYRKSAGIGEDAEKMAVIIQEVVGRRCGDRFYPDVSGVARSYNFYPVGRAKPEDGVVELALGLGKTIVDGGACWSYSPAFPKAPPPYNSIGDLLKQTQTEFWSVNMGKPPAYDPLKETEYLVKSSLVDAELDGSLRHVASTFDPEGNRIVPGVVGRGPRLLNFAPVLIHNRPPLNALLKRLLAVCAEAVGSPVEIEFALTLDPRDAAPARLGFLQVRPMVVSHEVVEIDEAELQSADVLVAPEMVMGNGLVDTICDVVYVKPESFESKLTMEIAAEIEGINRELVEARRPYLLVGFGRWGTSDPWGGIPVNWGQISGARVIVEAAVAGMNAEMSQGSHFFHNMTSFRVLYFSASVRRTSRIDWSWLSAQPAVAETRFIRHVRLSRPLLIKADGRHGRGVILHHD